MTIPMVHFFMTDLGDVRLADEFVKEAAKRWPGSAVRERWNLCPEGPDETTVTEPLWVAEVMEPITALVAARTQIHTLKSLRALEPYGLKA